MTPKKKLISIRVSDHTVRQIKALEAAMNLNQTEVVLLAVDRLAEMELHDEMKDDPAQN